MEIKKLNKDLVNDYLKFFDETPHDDEIPEHKCYCMCWVSADCEKDDDWTVEARRKLAEKYIMNGCLQGYLAYVDGKAVGWCNTNTKRDCFLSRAGRMYLQNLPKDEENLKIKSIFCFVIAPEMRRKGIATSLAERVIEDAKNDGFDFVEAYPNKEFISNQYDYMGPTKMYDKLGFDIYADLKDRLIVRKKL